MFCVTQANASPVSRTSKKCKFPGKLVEIPVGRKLKTIAPLWHRKRNLFSWKRCTQEP